MQLRIRGIKQFAKDSMVIEDEDPIQAFEKALAVTNYTSPDPIIQWDERSEIACLDIDFHGQYRPDRRSVASDLNRIILQPRFSWVSHGGGAKLVYFRNDLLTANEQAVLAIGLLGNAFGGCDVPEIKTDTRHPAYPRMKNGVEEKCGDKIMGLIVRSATDFQRAVAKMFGNQYAPDSNELDAWLEWLDENGLELGQRVSTRYCIIKADHSESDDVSVCDGTVPGLYCFKCAGTGLALNGCKPGWMPWFLLTDSWRPPKVNTIRECVKKYAHFEQGRLVLQQEMPTLKHRESWEETAYRALLRLYHLRDVQPKEGESEEDRGKRIEGLNTLINQAFVRHPLIRAQDHWLETDLATPVTAGLKERVAALPAVRFWDTGAKKLKVDSKLVGEFIGGGDLTKRGYPPVVPIRGIDLAAEVRPATGRIYVPVKKLIWTKPDPEFVDKVFTEAFPTIDMRLLRLLLTAGGFAQRDNSPYPPMITITGQTGAGKSGTVYLAAALLDCLPVEVTYQAHKEDHTLRTYNQRFPIALFDDFYSGKPKPDADQLRQLITQRLKKDATFHGLYHGPSRIITAAACVFTEIELPPCFRGNSQIARRMIHVDIGTGARGHQVEWSKTCRGDLGDGSIAGWKDSDAKNARACNMLLTEIQDQFFHDPYSVGTWFQAAGRLGFKPLSEVVSEDDPRTELQKLFEVASATPDAEDDPNFQGRGWKVFHLETGPHNLKEAFGRAVEACGGDANNDQTWEAFRSMQWVDVLGIKGAQCMIKKRGRKIGLKWKGPSGMILTDAPASTVVAA